MAAAGDHRARSRRGGNAHEHRPQAERAEPQPELIILGQAGGGEGQAVIGGGEPLERAALDRAADPGEGNRRADRLAHDQFLDVALRELVGIMAADPARRGVGQGQDGQLDQRGALDQPVEQPELERVDEVLGVVEHDRLGARGARRFVGDQRAIEDVEAVGLGRRAVGGDRDRADARVARRRRSPRRWRDRCDNDRRRGGNRRGGSARAWRGACRRSPPLRPTRGSAPRGGPGRSGGANASAKARG